MTTKPSRRQINRQRRRLTAQQQRQAAAGASTHLHKLGKLLPKHAKVGIYLDAFGELPTQPILDWCLQMGYQAYLPVVGKLGAYERQMRFVPVMQSRLMQLRTAPHRLGMPQYYHRQLLPAEALDVVFCPLVAADERGNRMGMGGGYYDATLAKAYQAGRKKPLRVGWCYEFQMVEQLPTQPWDVPLNVVITPEKIRWFFTKDRNQSSFKKESSVADYSAENIEQHLKNLEVNNVTDRHLNDSQDLSFSSEELKGFVNEKRLDELLALSDAFLKGLSKEIEGFDEGNNNQ